MSDPLVSIRLQILRSSDLAAAGVAATVVLAVSPALAVPAANSMQEATENDTRYFRIKPSF